MKFILMLAVLLAVPLAHAHGDKPHAPAAQAVAEQTDWGIAGTTATRTVTIDLLDTMRFSPDRVEVALGETVRFEIRNRGRMLHEMVIGTPAELAEHARLMAKNPGMEHDAPYMAHVDPGKTGEIVWTFNRAGEFEYACLLPGHYEAGMRGRIVVKAGAAAEPAATLPPPASEGVVRRIDAANGKLTLKHGRLDNLDMPPMTMVFRASQAGLLHGLKVGDRVRFDAVLHDGVYTVTRIERLP